jgi:hypothetical protein
MSTTIKIISLRMNMQDYDDIRKFALQEDIPASILLRKFIKTGMREVGLIPNRVQLNTVEHDKKEVLSNVDWD